MDKNTIYYKQVGLLLRVLPVVAEEECFALKGGTAINLFIRDLPRLSVDIDLVYLPLDEREAALANAKNALDRIAEKLKAQGLTAIHTSNSSEVLRLQIRQQDTAVKLELSPVMRGTVFPPEIRSVTEKVEDEFGFAEIPVTSFADLYAGKICAALDRQHPRDLFDIKLLLENEGIDDHLRKTFLAYLISSGRPINELLNPRLKSNIRDKYQGEFAQMTALPVTIEELEDKFRKLVETIHSGLTEDEKRFLISFKKMKPEWSLLGLEGIADLPAVRWKQLNLQRMSTETHRAALNALEDILRGE